MSKEPKILFVSSGNIRGIVPFIKSQGESLKDIGLELEYHLVMGKGLKGYVSNIRPLRSKIIEGKYDLIHAHYGLVGLLALLTLSGRPIVLSMMGGDAYGSFDAHGKRVKGSYFQMFLSQIAMLFSSQIIAKSENILSHVPYKFKSTVIPNGVNFNIFKPDGKDLKTNKILWLANPNDPRKNFKLLQDALELLNDVNVELITPYPISHNEFPAYLNGASVFVLSSYSEGSPNVIKEAMACNIPIVSTNVGDVTEIIGETNGCYIANFEPGDMADKIRRALDYGRRTTGREDVRHLEAPEVARRIIKVYDKAIK
jgi:glycosyltransferase involved in cell wall biosynthesis